MGSSLVGVDPGQGRAMRQRRALRRQVGQASGMGGLDAGLHLHGLDHGDHLSGLDLRKDDWLMVEIAVKLVRLKQAMTPDTGHISGAERV